MHLQNKTWSFSSIYTFSGGTTVNSKEKEIRRDRWRITCDQFQNIVGSNETRGDSLSELSDKELQATDCTPPTSQQGNQLLFLCPAAVWKMICAVCRM